MPPLANAGDLCWDALRVVAELLSAHTSSADVRAAAATLCLSKAFTNHAIVPTTIARVRSANMQFVQNLLPRLWASIGEDAISWGTGPLGHEADAPRDRALQKEGADLVDDLTAWIRSPSWRNGWYLVFKDLWWCGLGLNDHGPTWSCMIREDQIGPVWMGDLTRLLFYECYRLGDDVPHLLLALIRCVGAVRDRCDRVGSFNAVLVDLLAHVMYFPTLGSHTNEIRRTVSQVVSPHLEWESFEWLGQYDRGRFILLNTDCTPCPYEACPYSHFNQTTIKPDGSPLRGWDASSRCIRFWAAMGSERRNWSPLCHRVMVQYREVLLQPTMWRGPAALQPRPQLSET